MVNDKYLTILDKINHYSINQANKVAFRYSEDGINLSRVMTYAELQSRALAIAAVLEKKQLANPYVLISIKSGIDFITNYIACLYAKLIAIPVDSLASHKQESVINLMNHIYNEINFGFVLVDAVSEDCLRQNKSKIMFGNIPIINHADLITTDLAKKADKFSDHEQITHLLFTSGSTSAPKGVICTHNQISVTLAETAEVWHVESDSVNLVWAPHSHVYGLICGYLLALYQGAETIIIPTEIIVKNPLLWLINISKYHVTHSGCPNFGYELCVQNYQEEKLAGIDLSQWQVAVCGGEAARFETFEKFCKLYSLYGFEAKSFFPAYGMTEASGLIASKSFGQPPKTIWLNIKDLSNYTFTLNIHDQSGSIPIMSVGKVIPEIKISLIDLETKNPIDSGIGEVRLAGPTIATYFGQPGNEKFAINTGDVGFIEEGELFLIGRCKEIIVINGEKYSPELIEKFIRDVTKNHTDIASSVVFPVKIDNTEVAVVYIGTKQVVDSDLQKNLTQEIKILVSNQVGIGLYDIVFMPIEQVPKTRSGKISRMECAKNYLKKHSDAKNPVQEIIIKVLSNVLNIDINTIQVDSKLSDFGINSLNFIKLYDELKNKLPELDYSQLTPATFYEFETIAQIAKYLTVQQEIPHVVEVNESADRDIAIIGMAGIFPKAENIDKFWENLLAGRDCISEIPKDRTDLLQHEQIKWGGFIDDIDKFDAEFFNISPKEALFMDPQHRLFLQTVWHVIESAGYSPLELAKSKTGVFVGVWSSDYSELLEKKLPIQAQFSTGIAHSVLANRVSYLLDLHGVSETIDTACSSSLVAIHHAVAAILNGDCDQAIAGGVNALLAPSLYIAANQAGMLSEDGRCKPFDQSANGFVRGEGVGAILLKPLKKALLDRDTIYGVIKATSVNHCGHTNSLTAPSPDQQAELIKEAHSKAKIDPASISYIEAHGTGTALGDPIEINGIKKAFAGVKSDFASCGIGSVKSNIGHLESAAGITGVIKVLLSLWHKKIPQTIHFNSMNPYIKLDGTHFYITNKNREWDVIEEDGIQKFPRRAGISSFGFGGTNAHVVLEENLVSQNLPNKNKSFYLATLSAKTKEVLQQKILELTSWLKSDETKNHSLEDICYTLNKGRSHFKIRIAIIINNKDELLSILENLDPTNLIHQSDIEIDGASNNTRIQLYSIAKNYVDGKNVDWEALHEGESKNRIRLPGYPFLKEKFWVPTSETQKNVSKTFVKDADSFKDHVISGRPVLPGVVFIELLDEMNHSLSSTETCITNLVWLQPLIMHEASIEIKLLLFPENDDWRFEVRSRSSNAGDIKLYAKGTLVHVDEPSETSQENIAKIISPLDTVITRGQIYQQFSRMKYEYGESFRCLEWVKTDGKAAVGFINKPSLPITNIFDAALQTVAAFIFKKSTSDINIEQLIPESIESVRIFKVVQSPCYVHAIKDQDKYNINLLSEMGELLVKISGFSLHTTAIPVAKKPNKETDSLFYYNNDYIERYVEAVNPSIINEGLKHIVLLDNDEYRVNQFRELLNKNYAQVKIIQVKAGDSYQQLTENTYQLRSGLCRDYQILIRELKEQSILPSHIVNLWNVAEVTVESSFQKSSLAIYQLTKALMLERVSGKVTLLSVTNTNEPLNKALEKMITGFFKSLRLENPKYHGKLIGVEDVTNLEKLLQTLLNEFFINDDMDINYKNNMRFVKSMIEFNPAENATNPIILKKNGVYLLTGGLGALGAIFAKYLVEHYHANLILTGRSKINNDIEAKLEALKTSGSEVIYISADISDYDQTQSLFKEISNKFSELNGIIHSAGVIQDNFILRKDEQSFYEVLAPKVQGTINLDKASANIKLDCFILFSSLASIYGNIGQSDYACANAFLDEFSRSRNELVQQQRRHGKTVTINWPLWDEGGMTMSDAAKAHIKEINNILPISTEVGLKAFEFCLNHAANQIVVINKEQSAQSQPVIISKKIPSRLDLEVKVRKYIKAILAETLNSPIESLDENRSFNEFGVDSFLTLEVTNLLEKDFGQLPRTLFYEYKNIKELAQYFISEYKEQIDKLFPTEKQIQFETIPDDIEVIPENKIKTNEVNEKDGIAIIGMSGRYPESDNLDQLWENLKSGKDCIQEIPKYRFDYNDYYNPQKGLPGKMCSKWGGFINDVDKFDPIFFNISGKEAEFMDPQERLMLEMSFRAIEDSGYSVDRLRELTHGSVGVYVGVMWNEYQLLSGSKNQDTAELLFGSSNSSFCANRISYSFDFTGPSIVIDTACSSSLVALHMACENIRNGDCEMALVGGVNLSLHPTKYVNLSERGFLARDGKCRSFGKDGDGYVPGEGVGAVLLKPLQRAIKDGDHIYGVIIGSAVQHKGKTNGLTVPNPHAQKSLIQKVLNKFDINPRTISYVEAHGTGTELGDPIEVQGLSQAFAEYTKDKRFCSIGSVKSNVGHLESAAGIVALTKVLLQMKHKKLVRSLHSETLNPHIDFNNSPFYVQQNYADWDQPMLKIDGKDEIYPRRAGISSFGAGGTDAHIVVEEPPEQIAQLPKKRPYYLVCLSAKHPQSLQQRILDLQSWIKNNRESAITLAAVRYTLTTGRDHYKYRCSLVVDSLATLEQKLNMIINKEQPSDYFEGVVDSIAPNDELLYDELLKSIIEKTHEIDEANIDEYHRHICSLAILYTKGCAIDWSALYQYEPKIKVPMPSYPFLKDRYWVAPQKIDLITQHRLHPLVDSNISSFSDHLFKKTLRPEVFYIDEHGVHGKNIFPGAAYIEMARAAAAIAAKQSVTKITDMFWVRPIVLNSPLDVYIKLIPDNQGTALTIYSENEQQVIEYAHGSISFAKLNPSKKVIDINSAISRCRPFGGKEFIDERFNAMGFEFGESFQIIDSLSGNQKEAVAKIKISDKQQQDFHSFMLHPCILDAAFRTTFGIKNRINMLAETMILFHLEALTIYQEIPESVYVYAKISETSDEANHMLFDIIICDLAGNVCVDIESAAARSYKNDTTKNTECVYQTLWQEKPLAALQQNATAEPVILFGDPELNIENLNLIKIDFLTGFKEVNKFHYQINPNSLQDYISLWQSLQQGNIQPKRILHCESTQNSNVSVFINLFQSLQKTVKQLTCQYVFIYQEDLPYLAAQCEAISSFAPVIKLLNPDFSIKTLAVTNEIEQSVAEISQEFADTSVGAIRYDSDGNRWLKTLVACNFSKTNSTNNIFKSNGVYLITGGLGGLGYIIATYIATHYKSTLVLTGRSQLDSSKNEKINNLEKLGSKVKYLQADIADSNAVEVLIDAILKEFTQLNGIIHSAGTKPTVKLIDIDLRSFEESVKAKISGTYYLDQHTANLNLDFFACFSSISAYLGDFGMGSYTYANYFMDAYMLWRAKLQQTGQRSGQSLSIAWPYWQNGGIKIDSDDLAIYTEFSGMATLTDEQGIKFFIKALQSNFPNVCVALGNREKIEHVLGISKKFVANQVAREVSHPPVFIKSDDNQSIINYLKSIIAESLKLSRDIINENDDLFDYGLDSIMAITVNQRLSEDFPDIKKTLLFEFKTIAEIATYLQTAHQDEINLLFYKSTNQTKLHVVDTQVKPKLMPDAEIILPQKVVLDKYKSLFDTYAKIIKNIADFHFDLVQTSNNVTLETIANRNDNKPVLLLIPPGGSLFTIWHKQLEQLSDKFQLISFNYPGMGLSTYSGSITIEDIANSIPSILQKMKIQQPINIVGWSFGSLVARVLAKNHPELCRTLTLVCPLTTSSIIDSEILSKLNNDFLHHIPPHLKNDTANLMTSIFVSTEITRYQFLELEKFNYEQNSLNQAIPTNIIFAKDDYITPHLNAKADFQSANFAELYDIESAGHFMPLFNPEQFNKLLTEILTKEMIMTKENWNANKYKEGSSYQYIQAMRAINKHSFDKASRILDIGCGDGRVSANVAELIPSGELLGIDSSESMIQQASREFKHVQNLKFALQDVQTMNFKNEFDTAFSSFCLHWFNDPLTVFEKIFKSLRSGGEAFFILWHPNCPLTSSMNAVAQQEKWRDLMKNFKPQVAFMDDDSYNEIMQQAGFTHVAVNSYLDPVIFNDANEFYQLISALPMFDRIMTPEQSTEFKQEMTEVFKKEFHDPNTDKYNYNAYVRIIKAKKP